MKKIFTIIILAAVITACSDKDNGELQPVDTNEISVNSIIAGISTETKTGFTNATAAWINGDKIGVFSPDSYQAVTNDGFAVSGIGSTPVWTPDTHIYWKDGTSLHKFTAYYPYAAGNSSASAVKIPNLGTQTGAMNSALDFLISNNLATTGVAKSGGAVSLTFTHAFALLEFNIVTGAGMSAGATLTSFVLTTGTSSDKLFTSDANSTIALSTGAITAGATTNNITVTPGTPPTLSATATPMRVLILPVTTALTAAPTVAFTINDGGSLTTAATSIGNTTFAAGSKYTYTVTISRTEITISTPTINDWNSVAGNPITPSIL